MLAVEKHWGLRFPEDYQTFYDTLGPGQFCDVAVFGPDGPDGWNVADLLRFARSRIPQPAYLVFHPDPGGIVPWGLTLDGWIFGWQPSSDDPDLWGVTACGPDGGQITSPELSFSTFLLHYAGVYDQEVVFLLGREKWNGRVSPIWLAPPGVGGGCSSAVRAIEGPSLGTVARVSCAPLQGRCRRQQSGMSWLARFEDQRMRRLP